MIVNPFPPDAGYIYALVNPVWPGVVKIGMAGSVKRRFFSYQTGDPYRAYRVVGWSDVMLNVRTAEIAAHKYFAAHLVPGSREWFQITEAQAVTLLNKMRAAPMVTGTVMPTDDAPDGWYEEECVMLLAIGLTRADDVRTRMLRGHRLKDWT